MMNLEIRLDHMGPPVKVAGELPSFHWPVEVPADLKAALVDWNERFSRLVASDDLTGNPGLDKSYNELNEEGERLAQDVQVEVGACYSVRYIPERRT